MGIAREFDITFCRWESSLQKLLIAEASPRYSSFRGVQAVRYSLNRPKQPRINAC